MRKEVLSWLEALNFSRSAENRSGYRSMVRQRYPKIFLKKSNSKYIFGALKVNEKSDEKTMDFQ